MDDDYRTPYHTVHNTYVVYSSKQAVFSLATCAASPTKKEADCWDSYLCFFCKSYTYYYCIVYTMFRSSAITPPQVSPRIRKSTTLRSTLWCSQGVAYPPPRSTGTNQMEDYLPHEFVLIGCRHRTDSLQPEKTILRTCLLYRAACKVEFQPLKRPYSQLTFFNF